MTPVQKLRLCFAFLVCMGYARPGAAALTWDANTVSDGAQDGGSLDWLDAGRWWDGSGNTSWSSGNDAVIGSGSGTAGTITISAPVSLASLTFETPGSGSYTLSGGSLDITTGNIIANASATIQSVLNGTAGLNKSGAGTLTLSGASANLYTGLTTITAGTLAMGKTAGLAVTGDISISGTGKLLWNVAGQVASTASLTMSAGTIDFGGFDVTLANFTKTGGDILSTARGSIIITGTLKVSGGTSNSGTAFGYTVNTAAGSTSYTEAGMADFRGFVGTALQIGSNSTANVATFAVGTGGLLLDGQTLQMNTTTNASGKGTKILLKGDVTASGVNTILMSGTTNVSGVTHAIDLNGGVRTFNIATGGSLHINDSSTSTTALKLIAITNGGLTKTGAGLLQFNGTVANTYMGLTTVSAGTLNLNKTANVTSIAGHILVNGGALALLTDNQIADASDLVVSSGSVTFGGKNETINSVVMTGGTLSTGNTGSASLVTVNYGMALSGGAKATVNSGGTLSVNSLSISGANIAITAVSGGNILIGGSSTSAVTTLIIGPGGLSMSGQSIQMNSATGSNLGSRIVLNGDFTATGTNDIALSGTSSGSAISELSIGSATRTFNIISGTTNITGISIVGTGGSLVKTGTGQLSLLAANTYTGATVVKGGSLLVTGTAGRLSGTTALSVSGWGTLQIGSPTAASNNGVVDRVNTAAAVTLGGADGAGSLMLAAAAAGNTHAQTLAGLVVDVGANTILANAATGTNTLTFAGASASVYSRNAGGYVDFGNQAGFSVVFTNAPTGADVSGSGTDAILIGATMNGRKDFVTAQAGVITAATYTATGTTAWDAGKNMNVTGDVTTGSADAGINSLRFAEAAARTITLTGTQTIASGMILVTSDVGNNVTTISGGNLRGSAGGDLLISQNNASNVLAIGSVIQDNGSATALTKVGAGVLVLTGDNTYTGTTYLLEGVLRAADGVGLSESNLFLNGGVFESSGSFTRALGSGVNQVQITGGTSGFSARDGALVVNLGGAGGTLQWGSTMFNPSTLVLNAASANNTLELVNALDLNGATRFINVQANTSTISGIISNSGTAGPNGAGLFFTGNGSTTILRLTADNTYTGRTLISNGMLSVLRDQNLGIVQGAVVDSIIIAASGRLRAEGTFTLDANRGIGIGSSAGGSVTGVIEVTAGNTLTVAGVIANRTVSSDGTSSGANSGALTKAGTGTLVLTNANTYSGLTTVSNGVLDLRNNNALGTTAAGATISSGASLQLTGGVTIADEALTINGTGISSSGALRSVSGNNTWTGAVTLNTGSRINSDLNTLTLDVASGAAITDSATTGTKTLIFGGAGDTVVADGIVQTTPATATLNLTKDGMGTLTLQGANVISGVVTVSSGRLVLDYSTGSLVLAADKALTLNGGTIEVKGGTVSLGNLTLSGNSGFNKLVVGSSTSLTLGSTWSRGSTSVLLIDLSASGSSAFFTTPAGSSVTLESKSVNGATTANMIVGGGFAAFTVKDANGRYDFAARDATTGAIVRLNAENALPTTGGAVGTAYRIKPVTGSTSTTLTGNVSISTLRIEATDSTGTLDLAGFKLSLNDLGLLYDGDKDFSITDSSATKTGYLEGEASGNKALFIYHYGTGKLTLGAKLSTGASSSIAFIGEGGLIDWNAAANINGNTHVEGVVLRLSEVTAMTLDNTTVSGNGSGYLNLSNGGILELTGTGFTRSLSSTTVNGKFGFLSGDGGGFSAFGADSFVDIKASETAGAASATVTWGSGGFLATGARLILGSKYADHQIDFRNNIDLNSGNQVIDVQSSNTAGVGGKLSGVISSTAGSLQKTGQGILEVTGANTYGGGTTVKEGTFLANNSSGSATGTGNVTVLSGARLGGHGTVGSVSKPASLTIKSGGLLSAGQLGDTTGQQLKLVTGAGGVITLSGTVEFDIFGNNGGTNSLVNNDSLGLTSSTAIALGGGLKINDLTDAGTDLTLGSSWQLIDWTNVIVSSGQKYTGTFTTFDVPALAEGLMWDYSQLYTTGMVSISAVPEPGRMMLLAGGFMALAWRRRRRGSC